MKKRSNAHHPLLCPENEPITMKGGRLNRTDRVLFIKPLRSERKNKVKNITTMPNQDEVREAVNDYGNSIARITMEFIRDGYSEAERDRRYKDAGEDLLTRLNAHFATLLAKKREECEKLDRVGLGGNFGEGYDAGFEKAKSYLINKLKE